MTTTATLSGHQNNEELSQCSNPWPILRHEFHNALEVCYSDSCLVVLADGAISGERGLEVRIDAEGCCVECDSRATQPGCAAGERQAY